MEKSELIASALQRAEFDLECTENDLKDEYDEDEVKIHMETIISIQGEIEGLTKIREEFLIEEEAVNRR